MLASLAVVAGVVALGALTSPEPEAIETPVTTEGTPDATTTTTEPSGPQLVDVEIFSVEDIEAGRQLDWERAAEFGSVFPRTLVGHDGWLYLFGSAAPAWAPEPGGLAAWRSQNGTEWESLGNVLGYEVEIVSVASTGQGLVATERTQDAAGFNIWLSDDGIEWEPLWVPFDDPAEHIVAHPHGVYGDEDTLIVIATRQLDTQALLEEHLRASGEHIDLDLSRGWGADYTEDGVRLVVYGPLGIPVLTTSAEELGLTEEEATLLENGFGGQSSGAIVWVSEEGAPWIQGEIEDAQWVESIVETPTGELVVFGFGTSTERAWRSTDGIAWEDLLADFRNPGAATNWGESLLARGDSAEILISEDAETWEETGLRKHFPAPIDWHVPWIAAEENGIAAIVEGWGQSPMIEPQRPDVPTIRDGDAVLSLDFVSGHFEMEVGDEELSWRMFSEPDNGIDIDLLTQEVIFKHPDSEEELGRFGFDELERAEEEYWVGTFANQEFNALVFSVDAESWSIQDLGSEFGEESRVAQLEMFDGRLVAAVVDSRRIYSPGSDPGFEVWTAPLP